MVANPERVFLENVTTLKDKVKDKQQQDHIANNDIGRRPIIGRSNFDCVREMLRVLGFSFCHVEFDAASTGLPVTRKRLYMEARRGTFNEEEVGRDIENALQAMFDGAEHHVLDSFLLPPYDGMFADWLGAKAKSEHVEGEHPEQWHQLHDYSWTSVAFGSDRQLYLQELSANPFYEWLTPRAKDMLLLLLCRHEYPGPSDGKERCLTLEMSSDRAVPRVDATQCLVPRGVIWLQNRQRPILGVESLLLQGCDLTDLSTVRPGCWPNSFLQDIAGNAFCSSQVISFIIACLASGTAHVQATAA